MTQFEAAVIKQLQIMNTLKVIEIASITKTPINANALKNAINDIGKYTEPTNDAPTPNIKTPPNTEA